MSWHIDSLFIRSNADLYLLIYILSGYLFSTGLLTSHFVDYVELEHAAIRCLIFRQKPPYLADFYLTNAEIRATTTCKNIWRTDSMIIQNERTLHFALTSRPMFLVRQAGVLEWIEIVLQVKNTLPALFLISLRIRDGDLFYCIR